jgi:hypothetical protein
MSVLEEYNSASDYSEQHTEIAELANRLSGKSITNNDQLIKYCCAAAEIVRNHVVRCPYKIITLCGSTRFKDQFLEKQKELTLEGNIVISVGCFGHSGDVFSEADKIMLDDMHKRKIDLADEIFIINVDGYIGKSTLSEIEYAKSRGKPVNYLEKDGERKDGGTNV